MWQRGDLLLLMVLITAAPQQPLAWDDNIYCRCCGQTGGTNWCLVHSESSTCAACEEQSWEHIFFHYYRYLRSGPRLLSTASKIIFTLVLFFSAVYFSAHFWQAHRAFLYCFQKDEFISGNNGCFIGNVWISATAFQRVVRGRLVASWTQGGSHLFLPLSCPPAQVNVWQMKIPLTSCSISDEGKMVKEDVTEAAS